MRGCGTYKFNRSDEDKTVPAILDNATRFTVESVECVQIGMPTSEIILFERGLLRSCTCFLYSKFT